MHEYKLNRFVIVTIVSLLLLLCTSCSSTAANIEPDSQANAYLEVFKKITDLESNTEDKTECIGVNLTDILFEDTSQIKSLFEDYANRYNISITWNNKIDKFNSYKKGYLIIFKDYELTDITLNTEVTVMLAPALASSGNTCIVEKKDGNWTVKSMEMKWIS